MLEDFPELELARQTGAGGQLDKTVRAFQRALQARPQNIRARVEFAKVLGQQHEIAHAERLLEPSRELARGNPQCEIAVARAFRGIFRQTVALQIFQDVHRRGQMQPQEMAELAVLLQQFGRFEEGLDVIEQCIGKAPDQPQPRLLRARLLRHQGDFEPAQAELESLLQTPTPSSALLIASWSELTHVHDARANYDEAIRCAVQAKNLQRTLRGTQDLQEHCLTLNRIFAELYDGLTPRMVRRWLEREPSDPNAEHHAVAHLLSFPRTGTTLLEQVLAAHPNVVTAPERVIFSKLIFPAISWQGKHSSITATALDSAEDSLLHAQSQRYFRLHAEVADVSLQNRWLIDKNPNHTSLWAGLIRTLPESRFILATRDPRDVVVSCFLRHFPLSEYSVAFLDWETTCRMYQHEQRILSRLRELLPDRFIEVRYEDLVVHVGREAARVFEFLGLSPADTAPNHLAQTQNKVVNSPSQADVRKPIYRNRVGRWENYAQYLDAYLPLLESD